MKVLIITDAWHPQLNGVVRTYEHINEELIKMGHEVHVISPQDFPITMPMPTYPEIRLSIFPYIRLAHMINEYAPDVIHLATEGPLGIAGRRYCMKYAHRFSTCYHTHFPDYIATRLSKYCPPLYKPIHSIAKRFIRRFHAPAAAMMVATKSLKKELRSWDFKNPIMPLTRGVDLNLFYPGPKTLFKDLKKPVALYVGRVAIEKNIETFLSMEWEGSKVIVGDGPSRAALVQKYPDAHFVGKKIGEALADHYRSADVFVFPSKTDTFGMVLVEAMACGLPLAGYKVTGPKDIITEPFLGKTGNDLSKATHEALKNANAKKSAKHAKTYYSWVHAAEQFEKAMNRR